MKAKVLTAPAEVDPPEEVRPRDEIIAEIDERLRRFGAAADTVRDMLVALYWDGAVDDSTFVTNVLHYLIPSFAMSWERSCRYAPTAGYPPGVCVIDPGQYTDAGLEYWSAVQEDQVTLVTEGFRSALRNGVGSSYVSLEAANEICRALGLTPIEARFITTMSVRFEFVSEDSSMRGNRSAFTNVIREWAVSLPDPSESVQLLKDDSVGSGALSVTRTYLAPERQ